ncbi:MAG TPA: M23 family metallopeptidase, partial [Bacteroidota bacterium]|nr:M23 family metallopeptidase [Bacteroidota bacterium]
NSLDIPFSLPISNFLVSQEFDDEENHFGVDFAGKTGDPIFAPADGVVVFSNYTTDYGNTMILVHGNKFLTKYKHNLCNLKSVGSYVHRGEIIALLGNTGKLSSSPHLHFEIWKNGVPKNPFKYLLIRN